MQPADSATPRALSWRRNRFWQAAGDDIERFGECSVVGLAENAAPRFGFAFGGPQNVLFADGVAGVQLIEPLGTIQSQRWPVTLAMRSKSAS